jgi:transcriptional regulator of acetoin/glycerol metabolism
LPEFCAGDDVIRAFLAYDWPGNVRELKHCIDRMAAVQSDGVLQLADMPSALQYHQATPNLQNLSDVLEQHPFEEFVKGPVSPVISIPETEKKAIARALEATRGERGRAARMLGIGRTTLYRKMKQYGFREHRPRRVV